MHDDRVDSTRPYLLNQLSSTARRFNIPVHHFYDLIRGMEMDLAKTRYQTFDELKEYQVAGGKKMRVVA